MSIESVVAPRCPTRSGPSRPALAVARAGKGPLGPMGRARRRGPLGFSLLEVLVTILLVGLGMFATIKLQMESLRANRAATQSATVSALASQIMDVIGTAHQADGYWTLTASQSTNVPALAVTWLNSVHTTLPSGQGAILCTNAICTVTISWTERSGMSLSQSYAVHN